jgi:hypothetical protein
MRFQSLGTVPGEIDDGPVRSLSLQSQKSQLQVQLIASRPFAGKGLQGPVGKRARQVRPQPEEVTGGVEPKNNLPRCSVGLARRACCKLAGKKFDQPGHALLLPRPDHTTGKKPGLLEWPDIHLHSVIEIRRIWSGPAFLLFSLPAATDPIWELTAFLDGQNPVSENFYVLNPKSEFFGGAYIPTFFGSLEFASEPVDQPTGVNVTEPLEGVTAELVVQDHDLEGPLRRL